MEEACTTIVKLHLFRGTTYKILWMVNKTMKVSYASSIEQKTMFNPLP
jgi:hypothetical protein